MLDIASKITAGILLESTRVPPAILIDVDIVADDTMVVAN